MFQNLFLRCPTPRLHCFLSSHWPSFSLLSFMAFFIPSIQFFFGVPRAVFCFGIHFNAILGSLPSAILWTWPYHLSWFCSISFIIVSSNPIFCLIVTFLILSFLDILEDLIRASISVASTTHFKFTPSCYCLLGSDAVNLLRWYHGQQVRLQCWYPCSNPNGVTSHKTIWVPLRVSQLAPL